MCEPATITMMVVAVAMAVKTSMDQKAAMERQREAAIANQKLEQEALLKKRAEEGDAQAMEQFQRARQSRIDEARVRVAAGEKGATTGNSQLDYMLQGMGFSDGLQVAADQRSAQHDRAALDLQMRGSAINFQNQMRTIDANTPSGFDTMLGAAAAGANAYAGTPGAMDALKGTATTGRTSGIDPNAQARRGV